MALLISSCAQGQQTTQDKPLPRLEAAYQQAME